MSTVELFARGRLSELAEPTLARFLDRSPQDDPELATSVAAILADVRERGDLALLEMAARFDRVSLDALEIPREAWTSAVSALDPTVKAALERAADNIRRFHDAQLPSEVSLEVEPGVRITRAWTPLARVGVYAPGGRAAYPSSVLMGVVPAKSAGVREIVVCSPPGPDGTPPWRCWPPARSPAPTGSSPWEGPAPSPRSPTAPRACPRSTPSSARATDG